MPRISTDKTIQVSTELHARIKTAAQKQAVKEKLPYMSMAVYLTRLLDVQQSIKITLDIHLLLVLS